MVATEMGMDSPILTMATTAADTVAMRMADTTTTAMGTMATDTTVIQITGTVTLYLDIPHPFGAIQYDDLATGNDSGLVPQKV